MHVLHSNDGTTVRVGPQGDDLLQEPLGFATKNDDRFDDEREEPPKLNDVWRCPRGKAEEIITDR